MLLHLFNLGLDDPPHINHVLRGSFQKFAPVPQHERRMSSITSSTPVSNPSSLSHSSYLSSDGSDFRRTLSASELKRTICYITLPILILG